MIFEAPLFVAFRRSLTIDDSIRLLILAYSVYLDPTADGDHVFDFGAMGSPEFRYAFDGEFRIDVVVQPGDVLILIDATRAQRLTH